MRPENKIPVLIIFSGLITFCIGMQFPKVEGSFFAYDVFVALSFFIISIGFSDLAYPWMWGRFGLGRAMAWLTVLSTTTWLIREINHTATHHTIISPAVAIITLLLLIIQFKNRNK